MGGMHASKLATTAAVVAATIGLSAGAANAQISGSTGGDYVNAPQPVVTHMYLHGDFASYAAWASTALEPASGG